MIATNDDYIYVIVALMPLSACMLVFQVNPFHALVIRGILGAVSALIYSILGAADVALTEALVGTLLAISLYAIAVRSSLVLRLGVLEDEVKHEAHSDPDFGPLLEKLRTIFAKRYMRLELVPYTNTQALHRALIEKEIHATCIPSEFRDPDSSEYEAERQPYHTATRVKRIYEIMEAELWSRGTTLDYVNTPDDIATNVTKPALEEQHS
jgi:putative multicomponent Na+:H+ antiporter subunit B